MIPSASTAESAAKYQDQRPTNQPTEMVAADSVGDGAGVTSERREAVAAAATDERMEREQSGSDGDDGESSALSRKPRQQNSSNHVLI